MTSCPAACPDSEGWKLVGDRSFKRDTPCGGLHNVDVGCEETRFRGPGGKVFVQTICEDGFESCGLRAGRASREASVCHDASYAELSDSVGVICKLGR